MNEQNMNTKITNTNNENNNSITHTKDKINPKWQQLKPISYSAISQPRTVTPKAKNIYLPEYNFVEITQLLDIESYFSRSIIKKMNVIFKEGYELYSENSRILKKVKERLYEFEYVTTTPFDLLLYNIVRELLIYSNVFIAKIRDKKSTSAKGAKIGKKKMVPIAGFKILPTPYVVIGTDDQGVITNYYVSINNTTIEEYAPEDIIHIHKDKKPGFLYGTPEVVPVIEDIFELRRIEENVTQTIYRTATPLLIVTVGTEEHPAKVLSDGKTELDIAKQIIENAEPGSALIFPERHKIEFVGPKSATLNVKDYLAHFKKRVFAGLSMSAYDFGETDSANRGSATGLSKDFINYCKGIQQYINIFIKQMFREIVAEHTTLANAYTQKYEITIKWGEIDTERVYKHENATAQLFLSGIITIDEARKRLNLPEDVELEKLFFYISKSAEGADDNVYNEESAKEQTKSVNSPTNQHVSNMLEKFAFDKPKYKYNSLKDEHKRRIIISDISNTYNIDYVMAKMYVELSEQLAETHDTTQRDVYFNIYLKSFLQGEPNASQDK